MRVLSLLVAVLVVCFCSVLILWVVLPLKETTLLFLDVLGCEKCTERPKVTLVFEEEGFHFSLAPIVNGIGETPLGNHVVSQETPHKVDSRRVVEFGIQIGHLANIVRDQRQERPG